MSMRRILVPLLALGFLLPVRAQEESEGKPAAEEREKAGPAKAAGDKPAPGKPQEGSTPSRSPPGRPAPAAAKAPPVGPGPRAAASVANLLRTRRLTVKFEKASLDQLVDHVRAATGINIFVHKARIAKDGGDADAIEIDLDVRDVTAADALALALEGRELGFRIEGNVLVITSKKDARGKPVLRIYSVAHLLVPLRDFPAPDMHIHPSGYEPPEPPEPEVVQMWESSEQLAELVRTFTGEGTWEDEGVRITVFRHHLFVRTYPSVHGEIERFLAELPR